MTRRDLLRLLAFTGVSLTNLGAMSSFFSACAHRRFATSRARSDTYGLTIMADGWRADMFKEMLADGQLPNIKKHLVDRGAMVEHCIGTFPSTSGPAHLPLINGLMPGNNNCPGLRWVDRNARIVRDYCTIHNVLFNGDFPSSNYTLYEILTGEWTTCIFDFVSRGAWQIIRPALDALWFTVTNPGDTALWTRMDRNAVDAFERTCLKGGTTPRYSFVWMPAIDHLSHLHGSKHEIVYEKARDIDTQVKRIMETLQTKGIYDKTIVSLVADHGLRDTAHVNAFDIRRTLTDWGLDVMDNLHSNDNFTSLYQNNAARGVSGNGFALLYFARKKKGRGWTQSYAWDESIEYDELRSFMIEGEGRVDLIDRLRNEEPIRFVIARERENVYRLFSKDGDAKIERDVPRFNLRYTVLNEPDPLGYTKNAASARLMDGTYHDKDTWFGATTGTDYPDALFQVSQLFDSSRCGDIVISSKPGFDLMPEHHKATHGGLEKSEMMVPCVIAGPGIREGIVHKARTVDLYPTYLRFLGIPNYDGEVLNVFLSK
jgi:predicted AlkP superfamily pyrophosphatase or phosphodiesterase